MKNFRFCSVLVPIAFCALFFCPLAAGQQSPVQTPGGSSTAASRKKHGGLLGLVPTYGVGNEKNAPPLTPGQKLRLAYDESANPFAAGEAAFKAEYYRGTNPRKKIGHGGTGYLKQWGASYLDEVSSNTFGAFLYPTLLHQDPRYYRKGVGSIVSRVAYSFSRVFVTRSDTGQPQFNASTLLGNATATALSNAYYPPGARGVGRTLGNVGWSLVGSGASNVFKEFWPDIAQRLSKGH